MLVMPSFNYQWWGKGRGRPEMNRHIDDLLCLGVKHDEDS
jgi:hypothetical protein